MGERQARFSGGHTMKRLLAGFLALGLAACGSGTSEKAEEFGSATVLATNAFGARTTASVQNAVVLDQSGASSTMKVSVNCTKLDGATTKTVYSAEVEPTRLNAAVGSEPAKYEVVFSKLPVGSSCNFAAVATETRTNKDGSTATYNFAASLTDKVITKGMNATIALDLQPTDDDKGLLGFENSAPRIHGIAASDDTIDVNDVASTVVYKELIDDYAIFYGEIDSLDSVVSLNAQISDPDGGVLIEEWSADKPGIFGQLHRTLGDWIPARSGPTLTRVWDGSGYPVFEPGKARGVTALGWVPAPGVRGDVNITLKVTDQAAAANAGAPGSASSSSYLTITVNVSPKNATRTVSVVADLNHWPDVFAISTDNGQLVALVDAPVLASTATTLRAVAHDFDGDVLAASWSSPDCATAAFKNAKSVRNADNTYSFEVRFEAPASEPEDKTCEALLTVTDGRGGTNTSSLFLTVVSPKPVGYAPVVNAAYATPAVIDVGESATVFVSSTPNGRTDPKGIYYYGYGSTYGGLPEATSCSTAAPGAPCFQKSAQAWVEPNATVEFEWFAPAACTTDGPTETYYFVVDITDIGTDAASFDDMPDLYYLTAHNYVVVPIEVKCAP